MNIEKQKLKRNVPEEVFASWQRNKRQGDGEELQSLLGLSAPTITNALKHGIVSKKYLVTAITDYFTKRAKEELEGARALTELSTNQTS